MLLRVAVCGQGGEMENGNCALKGVSLGYLNLIQSHSISFNIIQSHSILLQISFNLIQSCFKTNSISFNLVSNLIQSHSISFNIIQYHSISLNLASSLIKSHFKSWYYLQSNALPLSYHCSIKQHPGFEPGTIRDILRMPITGLEPMIFGSGIQCSAN